MTTEYPTIRATVDALKSIISNRFTITVWYSGSDDSGWFDGFQIKEDINGDDLNCDSNTAHDLVSDNKEQIERELYTILESRFPGWEIGDGHVRGSHGWFTIHSTGTITQHHELDYEESDDMSPSEEITF